MQYAQLIPVDDGREIRHRIAVLSRAVKRLDDTFQLRLPPGWVAVPGESGLHFDEGDRDRILALSRKEKRQRLWAIALENLDGDMEAFDVPATAEGLEEFNRKLGHFNYALCPDDCSWVIAGTTDDYFVVMGTPLIAESILGRTVAQAYADFEDYAQGNEFLQSRLQAIQRLGQS
jgi:hypothetical protein